MMGGDWRFLKVVAMLGDQETKTEKERSWRNWFQTYIQSLGIKQQFIGCEIHMALNISYCLINDNITIFLCQITYHISSATALHFCRIAGKCALNRLSLSHLNSWPSIKKLQLLAYIIN
jgi:hypothetical protein